MMQKSTVHFAVQCTSLHRVVDSAIVPALVFRRCNSSPHCTSGRVGLGLGAGGEICCSLPLHNSGHPFLSAWANLHKEQDEENNYGRDDEDEDNDDTLASSLLVNHDMPLPPYHLILQWLEWLDDHCDDDDYDDDDDDEGKLLTKRLGLGASRSRNGTASRVPTLYSTTLRTKSQNCKTSPLCSCLRETWSMCNCVLDISVFNEYLYLQQTACHRILYLWGWKNRNAPQVDPLSINT